MTGYSTSLRLWEGTPGDPAIKNAWGTALNTNDNLIEAAIIGTATVSVAGQSTYTLSTNNGAADQARPLLQVYTGALTGDCTVTVPNVPKIGYAQNNTTGGHNIILTAGAGTTATIPPGGAWYLWSSDGSTNASRSRRSPPPAARQSAARWWATRCRSPPPARSPATSTSAGRWVSPGR